MLPSYEKAWEEFLSYDCQLFTDLNVYFNKEKWTLVLILIWDTDLAVERVTFHDSE